MTRHLLPAAALLGVLVPRAASAIELSPACAGYYPNWTPAAAQDNAEIPAMEKPVRGAAFADVAYKTCVARVTDYQADGLKGFARHEYSRRQAFNADDSQLLITSGDGSWWLYDAKTSQKIKVLTGMSGDAEPQWHPTNPDLLYYVPRDGVGLKLYELSVSTNVSRVVGDFAARLSSLWPGAFACWTHDYGSPSADGRYFVFSVADSNWQGLGVFTWDRETDSILGTYTLPAGSPQALPTMSPSGKYVIVSWGKEGGATDRFTLDFKNQLRVSDTIEHSDVARAADGTDTYVSVDYQADGGPVYIVNLETGKRTNLFPTYLNGSSTAMHFSGKAFQKPGWALLSTYADSGGPRQWLHRKIFAVELKAKPRIVPLAHHHAFPDGYWTEPHATVNRDFTRILFNSNWDVHSELDVDTYSIELPAQALEPSGASSPAPSPGNTSGIEGVAAPVRRSRVGCSLGLGGPPSGACAFWCLMGVLLARRRRY